jgi:hypothetical protein
VPVSLQYIRPDYREITERPLVRLSIGHLVIGHQRHDIDVVEALNTLQSLETAGAIQVVVRHDLNVTDEPPIQETLANALQQGIAVCGLEPFGAHSRSRRQEGEPDTHRELKLRNRIVRRRHVAPGVKKVDKAR